MYCHFDNKRKSSQYKYNDTITCQQPKANKHQTNRKQTKMTKFVDVTVTFNNGSSVINKVSVPKNKYASIQSAASTKRSSLTAKVVLGSMTAKDAQESWNKTVRTPWINMVTEPVTAAYPEEVRNLITNIEPVSNVLNLELPEANA